MMTLPDTTEALRVLATKRFDGWTEADVREEFIAPLLRLLGYAKETDYDINRERQHLLSKPFLMIGSHKQKLDYALLVRRRTFWLLEAKRPDPFMIPVEAVFQAHFYALHPEVAARYFGVCNGHELVLYDVRNLDQDYKPVIRLPSRDLPTRFGELNEIIGASSLVHHLKKRVLEDTREILSVEVREERIDQFSREMNKLLSEIKPVVRDNAREIWHQKNQERDENLVQLAKEGTPRDIARILLEFVWSRHQFDLVFTEYRTKVEELTPDQKDALRHELIRLLSAPLRTGHRWNVLRLCLRDMAAFSVEQRQSVAQSIREAIRGYPSNEGLRVLWHFEGALHRAVYKSSFASQELLASFESLAETKNATLRDEEIVWQKPSVWQERNNWVTEHIDGLWRRLSRGSIAQLLAATGELEKIEANVDATCRDEIRRRTAHEGDLNFFADYDRPWDYMRSGIFGLLVSERDVAYPLLDASDLDEIANTLRRVSEDYVVNHADVVWAQTVAKKRDISIRTPLATEAIDRLGEQHLSDFFMHATINRKGWSALKDGIRVLGKAPGGYLEFDATLDLDNRRVAVEAAHLRD